MWTFRVVVRVPILDDDLRFAGTVEDLTIQAFVPEFAIEGFAVAVAPCHLLSPVGAILISVAKPVGAIHLGKADERLSV